MFPNATVERMDFDTTRGKFDYDNIIERFEKKNIDIGNDNNISFMGNW